MFAVFRVLVATVRHGQKNGKSVLRGTSFAEREDSIRKVSAMRLRRGVDADHVLECSFTHEM